MNEIKSYYNESKVEEFIKHHGVIGMHWGQRRYQNYDGSLTAEGKKHRQSSIAKKISDHASETVRKASKTISTAARKTFNPNPQDMDEKIAKAKEREEVKRKKAELKAIKNNYKNIDQMSDEQVKKAIQSISDRNTLLELREKEEMLKKGSDYIAKQQNKQKQKEKANTKSIGTLLTEAATYGVSQASKAAIDVAVQNAKNDALEKNKNKEKSKSEKLKEELQDAKNEKELANLKLEKSMRKKLDKTAKTNIEYDMKISEMKKEALTEANIDAYNDIISRIKGIKIQGINKPKSS